MQKLFILKVLPVVFLLFHLTVNVSAQKTKPDNMCLAIVGAEHRYTQVINSKEATQEVIDNINSVIEKFDSNEVIYVYTVHKALWLSIKGPKVVLDSVGMVRDERINLVNNNIITKKEVNAFEDKKLIQFLEDINAKDIVIIGFMADYYVKESLIGGNELAYNMYFVPEAIMGKSEKNKEKIFRKLVKKGIHQIPISDL